MLGPQSNLTYSIYNRSNAIVQGDMLDVSRATRRGCLGNNRAHLIPLPPRGEKASSAKSTHLLHILII